MRGSCTRLHDTIEVGAFSRDVVDGTATADCGRVRFHHAMLFLATAACTAEVDIYEDQNATEGSSIVNTPYLSGCHGQASSSIPADHTYVMTTFGGPGDHQSMSCGGYADGTGWYAASRQRYGCGAKLQIEANGKCVVVSALDYGPDVCVETAAHKAVMDLSPRASKALYGVSGAGWSDHLLVTVTEVASGTALGPCTTSDDGGGGGSGSGGGSTGSAICSSSTLDRDVDDGTCVQSATDALWYRCDNGSWTGVASSAGCASAFAWCSSATLGYDVPPRTCVQSASTSLWYQCNGQSWVRPVDTAAESGALGACSSWNPL